MINSNILYQANEIRLYDGFGPSGSVDVQYVNLAAGLRASYTPVIRYRLSVFAECQYAFRASGGKAEAVTFNIGENIRDYALASYVLTPAQEQELSDFYRQHRNYTFTYDTALSGLALTLGVAWRL